MTSHPPDATAAAAHHARLARQLSEVTEFDLKVALQNVGNSMPAVERLLTRFVKHYRHGEPALAQLAATEPIAAWRFACHSLRGACATIGASALPSGLAAFEQALRVPGDLDVLARQAQAVNANLRHLVDRLAAALEL